MIVAVVRPSPAVVVIGKFSVLLCAGTVTDGGTCAAEVLLFSLTVTPPAPAGPVKDNVPIEEAPAITEPGETDMD